MVFWGDTFGGGDYNHPDPYLNSTIIILLDYQRAIVEVRQNMDTNSGKIIISMVWTTSHDQMSS